MKRKLKEDANYLNSTIVEDKNEALARRMIENDKRKKRKMLKIKKSSYILPKLKASTSVPNFGINSTTLPSFNQDTTITVTEDGFLTDLHRKSRNGKKITFQT